MSWSLLKPPNHLVLLGVVTQMATLAITFPVWQIRQSPPNLPFWRDETWRMLGIGAPEFSFGWLLLLSLLLPIVSPLRGTIIHLALLSVAIAFDQFRLQPQVVCVALLMLVATTDRLYDYGRWFLAALWFWAGLHKWLSAEWFGYIAESLVTQIRWLPANCYPVFALGVAVIEITLGVVAVFKPRVAAIGGPLLHLAIVGFLSPLGISKNISVVPWNFYTALMAAELFRDSRPLIPRTFDFRSRVIRSNGLAIWAVVVLILPAGFYTGHVDRTLSFVLYSGNLPQAMVTHITASPTLPNTEKVIRFEKIEGWGRLAVPFPRNHFSLIQYFEKTAGVGSKLHVQDPRPWVNDRFFVMTEAGQREIDVETFLMPQDHSPPGNPLDDQLAVLALDEYGCRMLRRDLMSAIYAVEFNPRKFRPESIQWLTRLIAVEQLQFENCNITDEDLPPLRELPILSGLGLSNTQLTDASIETLAQLPGLEILHVDGTGITPQGLQKLGRMDQETLATPAAGLD